MRLNADDPVHARRYGRMLWSGSFALAVIFSLGLARGSYWVVALPAVLVVGAACTAMAIVGRLLMTTPDEPPDPEP